MHTAKTRLAIAGRIAAGAMANPQNMASRDHETVIANAAWSIAGKLCRIAAQYEAENTPEAIAEATRQYQAARLGRAA